MADQPVTKEKLINAQKDAQSLDDFINGGDEQIVVTRLLKEYPTLANAIRQIYEKGGKFYPTLAAANADIANIRTDVYVITGDNGAYYKATAGATSLTKSPYDPLTQAKADATTKANAAEANAIAAATTKANAAQANAIAAAATDATTKANAAQANAIAAATTKANAAEANAIAAATTKANAAEANAKTYADQNKLDIKKIQHSYQGGNLIGQKSARYLNFGVTSGFLLSALYYYDSVVIPVNADDILFILNDKQIYASGDGGAYAFFAEDPYLNRTQARIVDNRTSSITDPETSLSYIRVTVPTGANYLILNTRYINSAGTVSNVFNWAIHSSAFNSSYEQGTEVITRIDDVKVPTVIEVEELSTAKANAAEAYATTKANAAEANAKSLTKVATDIFDASAHSNNYSMTFLEAINSVPVDLRKQGLIVRYNNADERTFVNSNLANWINQRFWIRQINTVAENKVNHADARMIYKGFILGSGSTITYGDDNYCMIIPIHRTYVDGVESKLTISAYPYALSATNWMFLDGNGLSLGVMNGIAGLGNYTIPPTAQYIAINLQSKNASDVLITPENLDIAKKYLRYSPDNTVPSVSKPNTTDGFKNINYGIPAAIYEDRTRAGTEFVSPFFKSGLSSVNGLHIAQIVKNVEVQKGQTDLVVASTGLARKIIITRIQKSSDGTSITAQISGETETGILQTSLPEYGLVDAYGFANIKWVRMPNDVLRVKLLVDANQIPNGATIQFNDNGEIHPTVVLNADKVKYANKGVQLTQFENFGVGKTISNMALPDALPVTLTKQMTNGFLFNSVIGDTDKDHQQTTLVASKLSRFHGKANIYADAKATYPSNPAVTMLRETGGAPFNNGSPSGYGVLGKTMESQWIHPDMCYAPDGVGGYKYWMVNSNFPNGDDRQEDANLFVSNDGINWKRIRGFNESNDGGIGFKTPQIHWTSNYADGFMSIPRNGNSFEFALTSTTKTKTITGYLDHDPAISYHNGYVNVYILYNLGFVNASYDHKYVVCYRTNNGIDWEIVREDGSTMPYNEANAMLIFTKTNGVRNHICFKYGASGVGGLDLSPQVVKVSDNEWYYYARTGSSNLNLVRYTGTSPYVFNWDNPQPISKNNATGGSLWHFGMRYYDGVFYCMTNGFMFTSTDGINFTTSTYPFFWRGMSSDIYKPTFVVGHDGKVKMAYGLQTHIAVPHPYSPQNPESVLNINKVQNSAKITSTLLCQYASLSDIMARSTAPTADAYVDVVVMSISQRTKTTQIRLLPCLRSYTELLNALDVSYDDEIYVVAHLNTRNGGAVEFSGLAVTLPNAALN